MTAATPSPPDLAAELERVRARFDAIVSNTPGLVYQFERQADGTVAFPYLSDGCQALLGLTPAALHAAPGRFLALILPEDRDSYQDAMQASASALWSWLKKFLFVDLDDTLFSTLGKCASQAGSGWLSGPSIRPPKLRIL